MSSKLDQGLDEIIKDSGRPARRPGRGGRRVSHKGTTRAVVTTTGGVQKNIRGSQKKKAPEQLEEEEEERERLIYAAGNRRKGAYLKNKQILSSVTDPRGESKVMVSNLPSDVSEQQIKEYFGKAVGPVKRAHITYGPNGVSRGIATVVFIKSDGAGLALEKLNGVLVDKRPMKIEVVLDAAKAPAPVPVRGLSERIGRPKNSKRVPKSAAPKDSTTTTPQGRNKGRAGRAGRPKAKTAQQLDEEMADYFEPANTTSNGATNGVDGAAASEAMDEIS